MINLSLNIRNPWSDRFENLWCSVYRTPFKNKFVELEVTRDSTLVCFQLRWTLRQSHAGMDLEVGLWGHCVRCNFYDCRHWDATTGQYHSHTQEAQTR